jgi:hypothetical protein
VFEIGREIARVGLDVISAIDQHNKAIRTNIASMNASYLNPKRVEILGKIENICSGL